MELRRAGDERRRQPKKTKNDDFWGILQKFHRNRDAIRLGISSGKFLMRRAPRAGQRVWVRHPIPLQELLAFITPKGRVFKLKVMPFGVANAPALFQELMNKILYILRGRPLVHELISRGAEMEAHINDVSLGTNTQEDHVLLLCEFLHCLSRKPSPNQTRTM